MATVASEGSAVSGGVRGSAATWRKQVMVGDLPPDFLRIMITPQQVSHENEGLCLRSVRYSNRCALLA